VLWRRADDGPPIRDLLQTESRSAEKGEKDFANRRSAQMANPRPDSEPQRHRDGLEWEDWLRRLEAGGFCSLLVERCDRGYPLPARAAPRMTDGREAFPLVTSACSSRLIEYVGSKPR